MTLSFRPDRRAASALLLSPLLTALPLAARAATAPPADADGALLKAVIAGPQRSAANRARDVYRHPFETLRFFGLKPGQTVIEISPGGGWYTEILAPYLRDHGHYYAAHNSATGGSEGARKGRARFEAKLAAEPAVYGHAKVGSMPTEAGFSDIAPPGGADLVLTFRNVHNWIEAGNLDDTLRAFYTVLKPGGVLGVEEHRATPGTPLAKVIATGYVPVDFLTARARAAGFEPAGASEVNANAKDTHEHPNGVWSLPPTLQGGEVGKAEFLAIGESDRMTLKFVKPR
ncbi:MAG TPA: methyltransferase [Ideonella sp.]|uniref:class I SAM-dependent methyltransferase n=1 Tax=Ideonella sp. TaxID=1929293 RepID=UPI002BF4806B|nr:methyltransferase [Ideonella sp.]HSI48523.1 methyltransferase [Ideonella sp.]